MDTRRTFLRRSIAVTGAAALSTQNVARPPNVILLLSDDQRHDTIAALGNREIRTPNLDRLTARGTAFTRCYTMGGIHGALCIPSRSMILTGRTLHHAPDTLPPDLPLWPAEFGKAGYSTCGIGKWHNDRPSYVRAFQTGGPVFFGGMSDHDKVPVFDWDPTGAYPPEKQRVAMEFSSTLFTNAAIEFLRGQHEERPFLLYVAYTAPHDPRMPPPPYDSMYDPARIQLPPNFLPEHPFDNGELKNRDEELEPWPRTPERIRRAIAAYYGMITPLDAEIGRLLDALDTSPHARNTLVIFAGDNGLALGQHGLLGKQSCYEHSLRVPLIMAGPGVPRGARRNTLCYLLDIYQTVCDLTGQRPAPTVEGRSLVPAMRGRDRNVRDALFLAYRDLQRAVREDRWKLIEYRVKGEKRAQLFDLRADPWEMHDLSSVHPKQVERLHGRLLALQRENHDPMAGRW